MVPNSLFLDDERPLLKAFSPYQDKWKIVRSVEEAQKWVLEHGVPEFISFDNDLGENLPEGYDFAKWLVEEDMNKTIDIPCTFQWNVHSANPKAWDNINCLLINYMKHKHGAMP